MSDLSYTTLHWRCHRGMLELDLMLLPFVEQQWAALDKDQKAHFEALLALPDPVLFASLMGHGSLQDPEHQMLVTKIRRFHNQSD